ncbi:conserved Plasmodium protein, unknown function [Plasmodium gallinaceum]|uniref:E3 ubiquitin-protein ligase listerin n=1 Tax=Plasmodium gallinaceum TaxID=5849 RepID=A0A1J1GMU7_PLAGA|nr:conserved Plasmodium protein, unknown function [Plasmodium gallinaceum]CRG93737.1 conserved Plasmodium protein, unknown function [Plasmodium gallinaceum]
MKKKKVIKLKEEYIPKSNYFSKDALLTNIFTQSKENSIFDIESKDSQLIVNCINKLLKKNLQTKLKALNELSSLLTKHDEPTISYFFSSFLSVYKNLIYHTNYSLRENLNLCLKLFIEKIKTKIKKHLNIFLPHLFISLFDFSKNVKNISSEILCIIFPLKNNSENEGDEKEKNKIDKLKLYDEYKLYSNIKKLNVNIINFYNCLKYIKNDLNEAIVSNLKLMKNEEDYDINVYLFNTLCFFPSFIYIIMKFVKLSSKLEKGKEESLEENSKEIVKECIKKEFVNFEETFNHFFCVLNFIYKECKDNVRLKKTLYLSIYNIIYLLKKNKINYIDFNYNKANSSIFNYICCIINNKDEYILKSINHLLLLFFFSENKKLINENFLRSYLSLIKQNKTYGIDSFNYNMPLFIFIFEKKDIIENFFFFYFLFYFLLLNQSNSSINIYYDILLHLFDYFDFITTNMEKKNLLGDIKENYQENTTKININKETEMKININTEDKYKNDVKDEYNDMYFLAEYECSIILCENILLLPLEIFFIQKKLQNCNFCFKNENLCDSLFNIYYCHKKKLKKKESKEKNRYEDLRRKFFDGNIEENNLLLTYISFIKSSNIKNEIIKHSLDLLKTYVIDINNKLQNKDKNNNLVNDDNNSLNNYNNYHSIMSFFLKFLLELKYIVFPLKHQNNDINIDVRTYFIHILNLTFINLLTLIDYKNYEFIEIFKNNFDLLKFLVFQQKEENNIFFMNNVFNIFQKLLANKILNKEIYFNSLDITLNLILLFYLNKICSFDELFNSFLKILFDEDLNKENVEDKLIVCIKLINFLKNKKIKFFHLSEIILKIYQFYISCNCNNDTLTTFYESLSVGEKDNILFEENFYFDIFNIYKNRLKEIKRFPENNFCSFFLKLFTDNILTEYLKKNYTTLSNIYIYFLFTIYLKINYSYTEKYDNLFLKLERETLHSYLNLMQEIYKRCTEEEYTLNQKTLISSNSKVILNEEEDKTNNCNILIYIKNSKVTFKVIYEYNDDSYNIKRDDGNIDNNNSNDSNNNNENEEIQMNLLLKKEDILSSFYILKLLCIYKIYYNIEIFTFENLKNFTFFCFSIEPLKSNSLKMTENQNDGIINYGFDDFFNFIYLNIECTKLFFFLKTIKNELKNNENNLSLFFIIYQFIDNKEVHISEDIKIFDVIYILKRINKYKIFKAGKMILKKLIKKESDIQEFAKELIDFKTKDSFNLKVKSFLFKMFLKYVFNNLEKDDINENDKINDDINENDKINDDMNENDKINDKINNDINENDKIIKDINDDIDDKTNNISYENNLHLLKKKIPKFFHSYIDENFNLNIKNEISCLNLLYHLINVSKIKNFNFFSCKNVQKLLLESTYITLSNFDIFFCCLSFINNYDFYNNNEIILSNFFKNYLSFLKIYYKKIYEEQICIYKEECKILNDALSSKIKNSEKIEKRKSIKKKIYLDEDKLHTKCGIYFLRFVYSLIEKNVILFDFLNNKNMLRMLIKIIYFILSVDQCCNNNNINKKLKILCIKLLKKIFDYDLQHFDSYYKIYFFCLKSSVCDYSEYFIKKVFFTKSILTFKNLHKLKKKVMDIYINTYYLFILFSNIEKFKDNKTFIHKTFSILLLNCILVSELQKLKNCDIENFNTISSYLCINRNNENLFLKSFINEYSDYEKNLLNDIKNEINNSEMSYDNDNNDNSNVRLYYTSNNDLNTNSSVDSFMDSEEDNYTKCKIIGTENKEKKNLNFTNEKKKKSSNTTTVSFNDNNKNSNTQEENDEFTTFLNKNNRKYIDTTDKLSNKNNEKINEENEENNNKNKYCSLYFLKKYIKNVFLFIDLNKNILDLYSFLLNFNYLKILLSMLNICLSSEYFIYNADLFQHFLIFLESNNVNLYYFLNDIKKIDELIENNRNLINNKNELYIFFFSLYLALLLITIYPNECIIIINENKLYNIISFNQLIFSNFIIDYQLSQLKNISQNYINTTFSYDSISKILYFKYKIKEDENETFEDVTAKLTLNFLPNYPFSHLVISDKIESLDKKAYIHNSIKSMYKYARNGNINEIFIKFDNIMNNYFQNKSQCNICFMLLYDKKTCDKTCSKCNASYHSYCLHKWFLTSHNTKCPSCQMQFNS